MGQRATVEYRNVPGYPRYRVGSDGSVLSYRGKKKGWKPLRPGKNAGGYPLADLYRGGVRSMRQIHRLVLEVFVGPCPEGMEACHNDGDPSNSRLDNLRWDTRQANRQDAVAHGTINRGARNGQSLLSNDQVLEIRRLAAGGMSQRKIAARFEISRAAVAHILWRRSWAWLEEGK